METSRLPVKNAFFVGLLAMYCATAVEKARAADTTSRHFWISHFLVDNSLLKVADPLADLPLMPPMVGSTDLMLRANIGHLNDFWSGAIARVVDSLNRLSADIPELRALAPIVVVVKGARWFEDTQVDFRGRSARLTLALPEIFRDALEHEIFHMGLYALYQLGHIRSRVLHSAPDDRLQSFIMLNDYRFSPGASFDESLPDSYAFSNGYRRDVARYPVPGLRLEGDVLALRNEMARDAEELSKTDPELGALIRGRNARAIARGGDALGRPTKQAMSRVIHSLLVDFQEKSDTPDIFERWYRVALAALSDIACYRVLSAVDESGAAPAGMRGRDTIELELSLNAVLDRFEGGLPIVHLGLFQQMRREYKLTPRAVNEWELHGSAADFKGGLVKYGYNVDELKFRYFPVSLLVK
jgi:hypothetical protein